MSETKKRILLMGVGANDHWDPLDWFRKLKETIPLARMVLLAIPKFTSRERLEEWSQERRLALGMYGWDGSSYEFFGHGKGEAYLKLRNGLDRGPYGEPPIFLPPDAALSDEAWEVLKHLGFKVIGLEPSILKVQGQVDVIPFTKEARTVSEWPLGIIMNHATNPMQLREDLEKVATAVEFVDPYHAWVTTEESSVPEARVVSLEDLQPTGEGTP